MQQHNIPALLASYNYLIRMQASLPPGTQFLYDELDALLVRLAGFMLAQAEPDAQPGALGWPEPTA